MAISTLIGYSLEPKGFALPILMIRDPDYRVRSTIRKVAYSSFLLPLILLLRTNVTSDDNPEESGSTDLAEHEDTIIAEIHISVICKNVA